MDKIAVETSRENLRVISSEDSIMRIQKKEEVW